MFLSRFFALSVLQEAPEQRPPVQPLLLPLSGAVWTSTRQQQRPSAGGGERNRLQGVFTVVSLLALLSCFGCGAEIQSVSTSLSSFKYSFCGVLLDPGEAAAASSEVKRLREDLRGYRSGWDVSSQLLQGKKESQTSSDVQACPFLISSMMQELKKLIVVSCDHITSRLGYV